MYKNKYNAQESLQRIKLMMGYDMAKTATENIMEQATTNTPPGYKIGYSIYQAVDGFGTNVKLLLDAINSIKSSQEFNEVNEYLTKFRNMSFDGVMNDELESDNLDVVKKIADKLKTLGINATYKEYNGGFVQNTFKIDGVGKASSTLQQKVQIPTELKDKNGVMAFQTYLDQKYPQGWAVRADGTKYITGGKPEMGYGRYGSNTAKMWAGPDGEEYKKQLQGKSTKTKTDVYANFKHGESRVENNQTLVMDKLDQKAPGGQWVTMDEFKRKYPTTTVAP